MNTLTGNQILITFNSRSAGRRVVIGPATQTKYGYRKHGDKFKVYEADMRVRPDLFLPVEKKPAPASPVVRSSVVDRPERAVKEPVALPLPLPPTLLDDENEEVEAVWVDEEVLIDPLLADMEWVKVNDRHLAFLREKNITTIDNIHRTTEEDLLAIKGIGVVTAKELKDKGREYPLIL